MYCAINYQNNTSLWITKDCSICELREGNYDLTQHIKTVTKLNLQGKFDNYLQSYTYEFAVDDTYFQCSMCIMAQQLYIMYQALGYERQMYVAPMEVLACPIKKDKDFYTNGVVDTSHQLSIVSEAKDRMQDDIKSLQSQIDIISNGAESNAAITEEVNASSEELSSLLENINQNCTEMVDMVIKLEESTAKFKL